jgi:hypothetical protein
MEECVPRALGYPYEGTRIRLQNPTAVKASNLIYSSVLLSVIRCALIYSGITNIRVFNLLLLSQCVFLYEAQIPIYNHINPK